MVINIEKVPLSDGTSLAKKQIKESYITCDNGILHRNTVCQILKIR